MAEMTTRQAVSKARGPELPLPPKEKAPPKTPRERFLSLGKRRIDNVVKALVMVGRFGNTKQYDMTDREKTRLLERLQEAFNACVRDLTGQKKPEVDGWTFDAPAK